MKKKVYNYKLTLPKGSTSPTDSIYKQFDIVHQSKVLCRTESSLTIYSDEPFTLRVKLKSGKIKELTSKKGTTLDG